MTSSSETEYSLTRGHSSSAIVATVHTRTTDPILLLQTLLLPVIELPRTNAGGLSAK